MDIEFKYSKDGRRISRSLPPHLLCPLLTIYLPQNYPEKRKILNSRGHHYACDR
jgi:hypothetical protein